VIIPKMLRLFAPILLALLVTGQRDERPPPSPTGRQSPINIDTVQPAEMNLLRWKNYCKKPVINMYSNGFSIVLVAKEGPVPSISGGPLKDRYNFNSMHFHWGDHNTEGSEHTIRNKTFPMELHAVHVKDGLTFQEASKRPDGLTVVAYFAKIAKTADEAWGCLIDAFGNLTEVNKRVELEDKFRYKDFLLPFTREYVTYNGSLTTAPFSESVTWIISPCPISVTSQNLFDFRNLFKRGLVKKEQNHRDLQPLNGRPIWFSCVNKPACKKHKCRSIFTGMPGAQCHFDSINEIVQNN